MPTSKVTEVGYTWPDIFITGNAPVDASDMQIAAAGLCAWGNARAGAAIPPHFGDVMAQIANRLNISGTPQSFLDWSKMSKEASE